MRTAPPLPPRPPLHKPMPLQPAFTAQFRAVPSADDSPRMAAMQNLQSTPILFSPARYPGMTMAQFEVSRDFPQCQKEYLEVVDRIAGFVSTHAGKVDPQVSQEQVEAINKDLGVFKDHLTNCDQDFFSAHKPIIYSSGKEMFHKLDSLLEDERIPLRKRMEAISAMAPAMPTCSGGVGTALQHAVSSLQNSNAGLTGAAYRMKINMLDALITEHVRQHHTYGSGNEVHFVNAYFNEVAEKIGVPKRIDAFISIAQPEITDAKLNACCEKITRKLNPKALFSNLAEEYLAKVKDAHEIDVTLPVQGVQLTEVNNRDQNIKNATLNREYGEVPTENYLLPVPEDANYAYQFARQPTQVTRHFIEQARDQRLVDYGKTVNLTTENADGGAIKMLGDLLWRDDEGNCEELKAEELLSVSPHAMLATLMEQNVARGDRGAVLHGVAQQVLDACESGEVDVVPAAWLEQFGEVIKSRQLFAQRDWTTPVVLLAAKFGNEKTMHDAIAAGVNIDVRDSDGNTPAMLAANNGHCDVLTALIEAKADIHEKNTAGHTPVMLAARSGHVGALKVLIDANADIHGKDAVGRSPMMLATENDHAGVIKELINAKADINLQDNDDRLTAAMYAAKLGHVSALNVLIEAGADLNIRGDYGKTAVMLAAYNGHSDALKALINAKADLEGKDASGRSPMMLAAWSGHAGALKELIDAKAEINLQDSGFGLTPAMYAVKKGHAVALRVLIEAGADLDIKGYHGANATMLAAGDGAVDVLKELAKGGANLNLQDDGGHTAAMRAAEKGHAAALRTLIESGGEAGLQDKQGLTAAIHAAANGHVDAVKTLIELHGNLDTQDNKKRTAMMHAAQNNHVAVVQALIDAGASIDIKDGYGLSAMVLAVQNDNGSVMTALLAAGVDIDAKFGIGYHQTAAMYAATSGHAEALQMLIDAGADLAARNIYGETAAALAADQGHASILKTLLDHGTGMDGPNDVIMLDALMKAAGKGDTGVLVELMRSNLNMNGQDYDGMTAAMHASVNGQAGILKALIEAGVDVQLQDKKGLTATMHAALNRHAQVLKMLIDHGVDLDVKDTAGETVEDMTLAASDDADFLEDYTEVLQLMDAARSARHAAMPDVDSDHVGALDTRRV